MPSQIQDMLPVLLNGDLGNRRKMAEVDKMGSPYLSVFVVDSAVVE